MLDPWLGGRNHLRVWAADAEAPPTVSMSLRSETLELRALCMPCLKRLGRRRLGRVGGHLRSIPRLSEATLTTNTVT